MTVHGVTLKTCIGKYLKYSSSVIKRKKKTEILCLILIEKSSIIMIKSLNIDFVQALSTESIMYKPGACIVFQQLGKYVYFLMANQTEKKIAYNSSVLSVLSMLCVLPPQLLVFLLSVHSALLFAFLFFFINICILNY